MDIEIQVPPLGESISEATIANWLKAEGDAVAGGETLVELETDKVMLEVPAPEAGVLASILKHEGDTVFVGEVLARIDTDGAGARPAAGAAAPAAQAAAPRAAAGNGGTAPAVQAATSAARNETLGPAAQRMVSEHRLDAGAIPGTGLRGQVTKPDVIRYLDSGAPAAPSIPAAPAAPVPTAPSAVTREPGEREQRVKMTRLRLRIAERLVSAQQTAAMLTTFNEVDMTTVMAMRNRYKDRFREKYGLAIGFMSFFTKACIEALRAFPAVNAEIDGNEIVYKNFYDIGVAVGTERGLVVPVVRDADRLRFIEVELQIAELARRARENKLGVADLSGGTFTISNGGVYGSMLSTPILNPPQSGILGMHNILQRPMAVGGQVEVRPMMYLALSYDHRIIDGREAVQFLVKVKDCIEDPARMMLEI